MLIYPEVFSCARVVNIKDPRIILHHVQISASQAAATNGRILAIATFEPELDGPPAAVLVHAAGMRLLDSASDRDNPVTLDATEEDLVLRVGQEQTLEFHPKEPEGVFPDIRTLIQPYTKRKAVFKAAFSLSVLRQLIRCLEGSCDGGNDSVLFSFYGPDEMVHWQIREPVTEGMDFQGIVMPVKIEDSENPLQKALGFMAPAPGETEKDSSTGAKASKSPAVMKAAKTFIDGVPKGIAVSLSVKGQPSVTVDKRGGKTEIYKGDAKPKDK